MGKKRKIEKKKKFWVTKRGKQGQVLQTTNWGKRDYKQRQLSGRKDDKLGQGFQIAVKRFQIGAEITYRAREISNRDRDYKSGQGLQIGAEQI